MPKLLVIDDEPLICQSFHWVFATGDVEVSSAGTITEGWRRVEQDQPDVIVLDLQLLDGSGLDLFDRIRAANPARPVIFLTAHGTTETAIERRCSVSCRTRPLSESAEGKRSARESGCWLRRTTTWSN